MHKHPPEMEGLADCQGTNKWPNAFILEKQNRQICIEQICILRQTLIINFSQENMRYLA
jgi:hypothetical protein